MIGIWFTESEDYWGQRNIAAWYFQITFIINHLTFVINPWGKSGNPLMGSSTLVEDDVPRLGDVLIATGMLHVVLLLGYWVPYLYLISVASCSYWDASSAEIHEEALGYTHRGTCTEIARLRL